LSKELENQQYKKIMPLVSKWKTTSYKNNFMWPLLISGHIR
jgi:hypothetical protein